MENRTYTGKRVVITGGGSGIGEALSREFAAAGAEVHILDADAANARTVYDAIRDAGHQAHVHACDVSDHIQTREVMAQIAAGGRIDVLINNAGIAHVGNVENTTEADLDRLYRVNIKGVYNCIHSAIGTLKSQGGGVILNMASIAGSLGISDRFAYSMTKGAVLTMTYSVAKDYIRDGIRCNSISPARVHTPFVDGFIRKNYPGQEAEMFQRLSATQPIGRMGRPEEIARLALYLCSEDAAFITGTDFPIDGGYIKLNG